MGKKIDLSKFKKPEESYLKPKGPKVVKESIEEAVKKKEANVPKKLGRPTLSDEPLSVSVSVKFTETEYKEIKKCAGIAAVSAFIRQSLKNNVLK